MADTAQQLVDLARKHFRPSPSQYPALKKLFHAFAIGEEADYRVGNKEQDDPENAEAWGVERTLDAEWLYWLCTDRAAAGFATPRGLQVGGMKVEGELDLSYAEVDWPLFFEGCVFAGPLLFYQSRLRLLGLAGTHTAGFRADRVRIEGSIFLCNGFKSEGEVNLLGAEVGGNLDCQDSHFINTGRYALSADGAQVAGGVFLRNGFKAEGEVSLLGAVIGGSLDCQDSHFINTGGYALSADRAQVAGGVFLRNGFNAEGEVRLLGAMVGGDLSCMKGHFINEDGNALSVDGAKVGGAVFLRDGFEAKGKVNLIKATVGSFVLTSIAESQEMTLDLRSVAIGMLWDEEESWPLKGKLFLSGLVYNELYVKAPHDSESRLRWLRLQPSDTFSPQPYEQLARVLREGGHEQDAKRVLIGKEIDRRRHLPWWGKLWSLTIGAVIAHGYRPHRALYYAAALIVIGTFFFHFSYPHLYSPAKVGPYLDADKGATQTLNEEYPKFNALVYTLDVFIPIVNLHQQSYWLPDANKGAVLVTVFGLQCTRGGLLRLLLWVYILLGWTLTSLWVAGFTGLVRRE